MEQLQALADKQKLTNNFQGAAFYLVCNWCPLQERRRVVEQLQALANERKMRVTFLSGGTGAAGVAQFYR